MVQPQFTISTEKTDSPNFGRFVIEPLPQGYGTTLGNALRRVLYTSIPGAAITSVYIPGVNHQFTTIDGDKPAKITLSVKGPGVITAGQFETPPDVKISNPELVIANLTDKNTKLEMEATVESGFGYSPAEERKSSTLGVIPTDASFTPVIRVNYEIQDTRVGRVTNFDKLIMEILTDGTITPQSALTSASQTLVDYFSAVVTPQSPSNAAGLPSAFHQAAGSNIAIEELDLPTRIANALQKAGFESVADLLSVPRTDLAKVKNLGGKSVKIIEAALSERGFELS